MEIRKRSVVWLSVALLVGGWATSAVATRYRLDGLLVVGVVLGLAGGLGLSIAVGGNRGWGWKIHLLIAFGAAMVGAMAADAAFH
jgi:hypothetical protein